MSLALLERPSVRSMPTKTTAIFADQGQGRPRGHSRNLSAAEERSLAGRIRGGDRQAIDRLVLANLGLVGTIASYHQDCGLSFEDLKQEGIRGLILACAEFDPEAYDTRFSTYASLWIRHTINRAIETSGSMIRLPNYMIRLRSEYRRTLGEIQAEELLDEEEGLGDIACGTDHEIASRMGIGPETLDLVRQSEIVRAHYHSEDDEGDSISFEEMIADTSEPHLDLDIFEEMECLREGIELLSPHEAWLIRQRFGLDDARHRREGTNRLRDAAVEDDTHSDHAQARSMAWIARTYGLSWRRLRRIETNAMLKLREHMRKRVGGD